MFNLPRQKAPMSLKKQDGMATILVVIIIGMLLTTATLAVLSNNRSTQEKQLANHALAHSQAGLWTGVEMFRNYVEALSSDERKTLQDQEIEIDVTGSNNKYSIYNIAYFDPTATSAESVKATIQFYEAQAKSNSAVEIYFNTEFIPCGDCDSLDGEMNFYGDLALNESIDINITEDTVINVDGNITISDKSAISGIKNLNATGNINLGSATNHYEVIMANGTFTAAGGSAISVTAIDNITLNGAFYATTAHTEGTVTNNSSGNSGRFLAQEDIFLNLNSKVDFARSNKNIETGSGVSVTSIESQGTVTVGLSNHDLKSIKLYGKSVCEEGTRWLTDQAGRSIEVNPSPTNIEILPDDTSSTCTTAADFTNDSLTIATVPDILPYVMIKPSVNVWDLKPFVNYAFSYDHTAVNENEKMRVQVQNIEGVADGSYYVLGSGSKQRFCAGLRKDATTTYTQTIDDGCDETKDVINACRSNSDAEEYSCFSASADVNGHVSWVLKGYNLTPGTYFFEGDVSDITQFSITTKLVTGNYEAGDNGAGEGFKDAMAPNFAGYAALCENDYTEIKGAGYEGSGSWQNEPLFTGQAPLDICADSEANSLSTKIANVVIGAGGIDYSQDSPEYQGGIVSFKTNGASSNIFGTILAGDHYITKNDINLYGAIVSLNDNDSITESNELSGSSDIFKGNAIGVYDPTVIPSNDCERDASGNLVYYLNGNIVNKVVQEDDGTVVFTDSSGNVVDGVGLPKCTFDNEVVDTESIKAFWVRFL